MKLKTTLLFFILFSILSLTAQTKEQITDSVSIHKKLLKKLLGNWKPISISHSDKIMDCEDFEATFGEKLKELKDEVKKNAMKINFNKKCNQMKERFEFTITKEYYNLKSNTEKSKMAYVNINNKLEKNKMIFKTNDKTQEMLIEIVDPNSFKMIFKKDNIWVKFKRVHN